VVAAVVFAPAPKHRQLEEGEPLESTDMVTESMDMAIEEESFEPPRDLLMAEELEGSDDEDSDDEDSDEEDSDDGEEEDEKVGGVMHRYRKRH
jgi:hypothetical protein